MYPGLRIRLARKLKINQDAGMGLLEASFAASVRCGSQDSSLNLPLAEFQLNLALAALQMCSFSRKTHAKVERIRIHVHATRFDWSKPNAYSICFVYLGTAAIFVGLIYHRYSSFATVVNPKTEPQLQLNRNLDNCEVAGPKRRFCGASTGFQPVASAFALQYSR